MIRFPASLQEKIQSSPQVPSRCISMEIDLLLETDEGIIPVEIKSGRHKRSTSLKNYMEKYSPEYAIRLSENNFGRANGIVSVPLYAAYCV